MRSAAFLRAAGAAITAFLWILPPLSGQVVINEWMGDNETFLRDADGDFSDWLELHNVIDMPVDLSGWQVGIHELWTIPDGTILEPSGYLVLRASGKDTTIDGELHTSFTIPTREWDPSSRAPEIRLLDAAGTVVFEVKAKEQEEDEAHGRFEGEDGSGTFAHTRPPTPGGPNLRLSVRAPWISSPSGNAVLESSVVTFDWSARAVETAAEYALDVSSEIVTERGKGEIFGGSVGLATSALVRDIPQDGENVYATLWTRVGDVWLRSVDRYRTRLVVVEPDAEFLRGDGNDDGEVDLSDAVGGLEALFRGGPEPGCLDAADANDDGSIDISDSIYLLIRLFLGGDPVPEPRAACGVDPSPDPLGCAGQVSCE